MHPPENLELITTDAPSRWDGVLEEIGDYDFWHLSGYHRLAEIRDRVKAVLLVYRDLGCTMAFPMLLRDIDSEESGVERGLKDVTSVRGLVSPVVSRGEVSDEVRNGFQEALQGFFRQNRVVAAYARLNPLAGRESLLAGMGSIVPTGYVLAVDLSGSEEVQFANYRQSCRHEVRRLFKLGFTWGTVGIERLDEFFALYTASMDRLHASPAYYFDKSYFSYLIDDMSAHTCLLACKDGEKTICIGIFAAGSRVAHGLYVGSDPEYMRLSPVKLFVDSGRRWANSRGATLLDIGGSNSFSHNSLSDFKMGFGPKEYTYSTWRHIVDRQAYKSLRTEACRRAGKTPDTPYFPAYRHPELQVKEVAADVQSP